ncbi:MAG: ABC transporter permease [Eubacteriales bacterium]|nr:ABC transporter permease [Eubacteriales bacterium]
MKEELSKRKKKFIISAIALIVVTVVYFFGTGKLTAMLTSQTAAQRWQGESEQKYTQLSCFVPVDQKVSLSDIYSFRQVMAAKFKEAGLDADSGEMLSSDAWSTSGKVNVSSTLGSGEVTAYAVGGDFFSFHPVKLLSGNYITSSDLMKDRVLLDEETAWLLFGGVDVHGMGFKISDRYFVVAGVYEREDDRATKKAFTDEMSIFLSYDAFCDLTGEDEAGINCYEVVMPEPVKGFAESIAKDKFPIGRGEILNNTDRYSPSRLMKLAYHFGERSMQNKGIMYPYWENAARYTEDIASLLTALCLIFAVVPAAVLSGVIIKALLLFRQRMREELIPELRDKTEEVFRSWAYKRRKKYSSGKH